MQIGTGRALTHFMECSSLTLTNTSATIFHTKDIRYFIATNLGGRKVTDPFLDDQDNVLIGKKVDALLEIEPRIRFQDAPSHISWYRFDFRAQQHQVALLNNFVKRYGR